MTNDRGNTGVGLGQHSGKAAFKADKEQLAKDRLLVSQLRDCGFSGRPWAEFQRQLVAYTRNVLAAKIRTGKIFGIMQRMGIPPGRDFRLPKSGVSMDESMALAGETIAIALPRFRQILMARGWDGDRVRAAGLRTYFVNQCALQFSSPWRRWLSEVDGGDRQEILAPSSLLVDYPDHLARPDVVASDKVDAVRALRWLA
jgi:hypothetical protein